MRLVLVLEVLQTINYLLLQKIRVLRIRSREVNIALLYYIRILPTTTNNKLETKQVYRKKLKRQETLLFIITVITHHSLLRGFEKNIIFEGTQQIPLHHHNIESILMASKHLRRYSISMEDLFTPEEHASLQAMVNVDGSIPKRDDSVQVGQKYAYSKSRDLPHPF